MARDWNELFVTGEPAPDAGDREPEQAAERRGGFFSRLRENMAKTRQALGAELQATMFETLDDEAFERLEEALIYADVGAPTTAKIVERLEAEAAGGELERMRATSRAITESVVNSDRSV